MQQKEQAMEAATRGEGSLMGGSRTSDGGSRCDISSASSATNQPKHSREALPLLLQHVMWQSGGMPWTRQSTAVAHCNNACHYPRVLSQIPSCHQNSLAIAAAPSPQVTTQLRTTQLQVCRTQCTTLRQYTQAQAVQSHCC